MSDRSVPSPFLSARSAVAFVHDVAMAAASFVLALYLRLGGRMFDYMGDTLLWAAAIFAAIAAAVFWAVGLYRGVWRYASMNDLLAIVRGVTLTILVFLPVMFMLSRLEGVPRSTLAINWLVLIFLLGAPRFVYRILKDGGLAHVLERGNGLRVPVLLVGAGDAAELFIREMARDRAAPFQVAGILDMDARRIGQRIHGVPVLGDIETGQRVIDGLRRRERPPQRLIVTRETAAPQLRRLLDLAEANGMTLARLPRLAELQSGDGAASPVQVRPVALEDLLGRPRTVLDREPMRRLAVGKRILITGAGGSIGAELARQLAAFAPAHLALLDHGEYALYTIDGEIGRRWPNLSRSAILADVRDSARLDRAMADERPELVFHAAALKHVPMAEANPAEAALTNAVGTRRVADAARAAGVAAMVLISTDKAVNPTSVLGATKRLAESYCQALDIADPRVKPGDPRPGGTRFITVRFGNVLGSTGSVVPLFQRQLAEGGPLTVTHREMTRYFMTAREAIELVLRASALGAADEGAARGRIFILDMGEPVRILDLARQVIRLSGQRPEIDIAIAFTGPRPGEKLTEELFHAGEAMAPAGVPGLLLAAPRTADLALLRGGLDELAETARGGGDAEVIALLRRLGPENKARPQPGPAARAAAGR
ncbi:MAG: nucleoside-diphosphate sugar epimerase/dehydratase [Dongiaceae bacterium]